MLNIRPDCHGSPETFSPKLHIDIVGDLIINGISPAGLSSKLKHKFRIKPYEGEITEDLFDNNRTTLKRKPDVIAIDIGANDITNDDCSSLQINLNKMRELANELSQRKSF